MPAPTRDIVAIGNAIVDVISAADEVFLADEDLAKGGMQLIDARRATELYTRMAIGVETSGGSAANTMVGMAALGCRCGFIGQVADDVLGKVFFDDIRTSNVDFTTAPLVGIQSTAQCLILVTPDGQRTMSTFLGASQYLPPAALDIALIESAAMLYLEGYLWDAVEPRAAMRRAIAIARGAGRKVALTLSDGFCVDRHRTSFLALLNSGVIDILFCNEAELLSLVETNNFEGALAETVAMVPLLIVTRGPKGALAITGTERVEVNAEPIVHVVDTTGAGDLFAAGFLAGQCQGRALHDCLTMGAIAAAEVISHYGSRPQVDLKALVAANFA